MEEGREKQHKQQLRRREANAQRERRPVDRQLFAEDIG
jgi:hypothetical protein